MIHHALLVEGKDEESLFKHLLRDHPVKSRVNVLSCGGVDKFKVELESVAQQPWFQDLVSLTVVRDADDRPEAAFASVAGRLREARLPTPEAPGVWSAGRPYVQVYILPNTTDPGCLETLFVEASRVANPRLVTCLERLKDCAGVQQLNEARWAKIFAQVILMTTPGRYPGSLGGSVVKPEFAALFQMEPLAQLRRILDSIHEKENA